MKRFNIHTTLTGLLSAGIISLTCEAKFNNGNELALPGSQSIIKSISSGTKVLIIGIDGCHLDALNAGNNPNIISLMTNNFYNLNAFTSAPTFNSKEWSTLLNDLINLKYNNHYSDTYYFDYSNFIKNAEAQNSSLRTISIAHWDAINNIVLDGVDIEKSPTNDVDVKNEAVNALVKDNPDILFAYFDDVDHAGHSTGFGPGNPHYMSALSKVDGYVGEILTALHNRPDYTNEDWLIIVTRSKK
ncbi:alkaline phosphatase family protein [Solitalea canadensis]|uniref:Putative AP superfamily protein n=1 Tax=Solitalea canadensis (strain ATCC 29591 / DSM 3403 / JCM 21819 / LMG 8368 / NBRC 15130 / NCIMB 12057 / USAM 9D) TaxID=929556 RepID=H8KQB4_SOLCM|nr:alkaline phosphatase family protein [Solitalea canadensis]AFD06409.1 putative AP superfamily protein [Solitalea canadensis DSM 3403]